MHNGFQTDQYHFYTYKILNKYWMQPHFQTSKLYFIKYSRFKQMLNINYIALTFRLLRLSFLLEKQTKYSMYNIQLFCPKVILLINPGSKFTSKLWNFTCRNIYTPLKLVNVQLSMQLIKDGWHICAWYLYINIWRGHSTHISYAVQLLKFQKYRTLF